MIRITSAEESMKMVPAVSNHSCWTSTVSRLILKCVLNLESECIDTVMG